MFFDTSCINGHFIKAQQIRIFIRSSIDTVPLTKVHNDYTVIISFAFTRYPVFSLDDILIGFPPGYLTAFQVRKMPDQYRIPLVNGHNLNRRQGLPD